MYLPKHQYIKKNIKSEDLLLTFQDGAPFLGNTVVELSNGDKYVVPAEDLELGNFSRAQRLVQAGVTLGSQALTPLLRSFIARIKKGLKFITRYFLKHKVTGTIVEISQEDYKLELSNPQSYRQLVAIDWIITGPVDDYEVSGHIYEGSKTKNRAAVLQAEEVMPGISNYITDYEFLAQDRDKFKAANILERVPTNLSAPSKQ
jgi:hypothetical protein